MTFTLGFSGGPLVDSSDRVVGVCSFGSRVGTGAFTGQASYTPNTYILNYLTDLPPSKFLRGSNACANAETLRSLSYFDLMELSSTWDAPLNKDQCVCCCRALTKSINAAVYKSLASRDCLPGSCPGERLSAQIRAIELDLIKKNPDIAKLSDLYHNVGIIYAEAFTDPDRLSKDEKAKIHLAFGSFLRDIATNETTAPLPEFSDAPLYALRAYAQAEWIRPKRTLYGDIADLFALVGDRTKAAKARILMKPWRLGYNVIRRSVLYAAWASPKTESELKQ
jgi:hypothetical protein